MLQKLSDAPLTVCPECGAPTFAKQLTAAGFQLKGSGWYATDFKNGPTGSPAPATPAPAAGSTASDSAGAAKGAATSAPATPASGSSGSPTPVPAAPATGT